MQQQEKSADIAVGILIRQLRIERGLTQSEVGAACGVTFQQIQKYERGTNRVSVSRLGTLLGLFGVTHEEFFQRFKSGEAVKETTAGEDSQQSNHSPATRAHLELQRDIMRLPRHHAHALRVFIRSALLCDEPSV